MEGIESMYEKKIDAMLSKMFGESDSQLKAITKLSLMNNVLTDEMKATLVALRDQALKDAEMVNEEMTMTLDTSGNVVPIEEVAPKELSPRQQDIRVVYHDLSEESADTHS
jgi:hypothetical protein